MKATFTIDQLIQEVKTLAQEQPNFVYQSIPLKGCYYTKFGASSGNGCLFGQAILRLQPELLPMLEAWDAREHGATGIQHLLKELGIDWSPRVAWCCLVQGAQDRECPWGKAVIMFME